MRSRLKHWLIGSLLELLYRLSRAGNLLVGLRQKDPEPPWEVLLTGTFQSAEWVMAFLQPLAMAGSCRQVVLVTTLPVPEHDGITVIHPPAFLRRAIGDVAARLATFAWTAVWRRPELVGGFAISINALVAQTVADLIGSRSMYVCVGGPIEVLDGGLWGESRLFSKLDAADPAIEAKLLRAVRRFDAVVAMGSKAVTFFRERGVAPERLHRMTGAVDARRFGEPRDERPVDIIFVGRLVPIKCLDLLLGAVRQLVENGRQPRARIVGRGPLEADLKELAQELEVDSQVEFAGFVPDVVEELERAKCFVLTSRSEGLSLAMAEAMLAGAVPIVADVGDLSDLIEDGVSGRLVTSREPAAFAGCIEEVLGNQRRLQTLSRAAHDAALRCGLDRVADDWHTLLGTMKRRADPAL